MTNKESEQNNIVIGKFSSPFGIKGYIKVHSYSGETEHFKKIKKVFLGKTKQEYSVEDWLCTKPLRCKIEGIDSPEEAKKYMGIEIYAEKKYAQTLDKEEYYLADLQGLKLLYQGEEKGIINGVATEAYKPLIEIRWNNAKTGYIPFIKEFFALPNIKEGYIELLREDLIEE